ncbi:MAG TPA: adenosylcobinamide-phosphate synthase CbiB [Desulfotignum sp.]|jgi:adenosylcobinamide-phosphate synthase|nr:adenosylcobinamide-phosphate synthase CbiB [Desulfotignum sp.]
MIEAAWYILVAGFVLDFFFGDPRNLPHPVVGMGRAISFFEPRFRRFFYQPFRAGFWFALFLIIFAYFLALALIWAAGQVHPVLGIAMQVLLLFYCFSITGLKDAAMAVARPLLAGDLQTARHCLAMIVGRETQTLDAFGVTRAAVETVAENFVDGFLSPLFWALLLGVPGAVAYKMVNTLDSMVGYQNDTYLFFGRAAARIDDAANFIPARLAVFVIAAAAFFVSRASGAGALQTGLSEGRRHKSPNAGFPEAAFAGALQVRLGGPSIYHGRQVDKPWIGAGFDDPEIPAIHQACRLLQAAAVTALLGAVFLAALKSLALAG